MARASADMPFLDHLEELRRRLIISLASVLVLSVGGYFVSDPILTFLTRPVGEVYFMGVTEAFTVKIKVALFVGLFASLPVIFYQFWMFVAPGLHPHESAAVVPVVFGLVLFFFAGAAFCFYVVLPIGIRFLLGFGGDRLKPLIMVSKYVSFAGWMAVTFGAVFDLPVVTFVLGRLGLVDAPMLRRGRRYAAVAILVVAAVVTPPDAFSQVLLAGPLYLLYEISIALVAVSGRKRGIPAREGVSQDR